MRRGYLEAVLPRENAGMDGTDCHVTTDWQVHAILRWGKLKKRVDLEKKLVKKVKNFPHKLTVVYFSFT